MRLAKFFLGLVLTGCLFIPVGAMATERHAEQRFDLVYAWDSNLNAILDYKEVLAGVIGEKAAKRLKVVARGDEYGVIYGMNGTKRQATREMVHQSHSLLKAGLGEADAIIDDGRYWLLYNICYGHGPNLHILKEQYHRLYRSLGKQAGNGLVIERVSEHDYTLVYRLYAARDKAAGLMAQQQRLLGSDKIRATLVLDSNHSVVYGESSLLHDRGHLATAARRGKQQVNVSYLSATRESSSLKRIEPSLPLSATSIAARRHKSGVARKSDIMDSPAVRVGLEKEIDELVSDLYRQGQLDRGERCAWMVYDVENGQPLVSINGNQLFQAASMIKPFIALAFFHQVEAGKLQYSPKARQMVERMIQHSSNEAANWVMRQVGGPANCERILRGNYGGIFRKTKIVEYIPAGGKTYQNKVIPSDYARFLVALWDVKLPYSKELQRVMALPRNSRIYTGTTLPKGTLVYNKTGSTARLCGDMGILVPPPDSGVPTYAMVGVIERGSNAGDYSSWIRRRGNIIRQVSSLIYKEIRAKLENKTGTS